MRAWISDRLQPMRRVPSASESGACAPKSAKATPPEDDVAASAAPRVDRAVGVVLGAVMDPPESIRETAVNMSREHLDRAIERPVVVEQMLADVAGHWGLLLADLRPTDRSKTQAAIRAVAMWALRERYGFSYPELGRMFGKDHTSVMHSAAKIGRAVAAFDAGKEDWLGRIARSVLVGHEAAE